MFSLFFTGFWLQILAHFNLLENILPRAGGWLGVRRSCCSRECWWGGSWRSCWRAWGCLCWTPPPCCSSRWLSLCPGARTWTWMLSSALICACRPNLSPFSLYIITKLFKTVTVVLLNLEQEDPETSMLTSPFAFHNWQLAVTSWVHNFVISWKWKWYCFDYVFVTLFYATPSKIPFVTRV